MSSYPADVASPPSCSDAVLHFVSQGHRLHPRYATCMKRVQAERVRHIFPKGFMTPGWMIAGEKYWCIVYDDGEVEVSDTPVDVEIEEEDNVILSRKHLRQLLIEAYGEGGKDEANRLLPNRMDLTYGEKLDLAIGKILSSLNAPVGG